MLCPDNGSPVTNFLSGKKSFFRKLLASIIKITAWMRLGCPYSSLPCFWTFPVFAEFQPAVWPGWCCRGTTGIKPNCACEDEPKGKEMVRSVQRSSWFHYWCNKHKTFVQPLAFLRAHCEEFAIVTSIYHSAMESIQIRGIQVNLHRFARPQLYANFHFWIIL